MPNGKRTESGLSKAQLGAILRAMNGGPVKAGPRVCVCGASVDRGYTTCAGCANVQRVERRRGRVRSAWATVPRSFRWASFDAIELRSRVKSPAAIVAAKACTGSALLVGRTGAGKTSLAVAMLRQVIDAGERAAKAEPMRSDDRAAYRLAVRSFFVTAAALDRARSTYPLGQGEAPDVLRAMDATLLVLDDLGLELIDGKPSPAIRDILQERHAQGRRTLVTTYLDPKSVAQHYGTGIARRLAEGRKIVCDG